MTTNDRISGILLGLAAGDRIGGPIRMALRVAESLRDSGGLKLGDVGDRYLSWWKEGAFDTGPTVVAVLREVAAGADYAEAAARVHAGADGLTAGCNPAHRSAPLAMCAAVRDPDLASAAAAEAALTHHHPLAGDGAAAVVLLCRALVRGEKWESALERAAEDRLPETSAALRNDPDGPLSRGGFAPDVLHAAVHFVGRASSFEDAMESALAFAGAANYCPVLVGSIGGARWGASRVPDRWLRTHESLLPRIESVAGDLAAGWDDDLT
jgi:ADP-ribosylglycohydrolase